MSAYAGYVYEMETTSPGQAPQIMHMEVQGGNLKLAMPATGGSVQGGSMIFLGSSKTLLMIDDARRQYMKLDQAAIDRIGSMLKAQMENIPPQQRAMVEQMMGGSFTPPTIEITDGKDKKDISGYATNLKIVKVDGDKRSENWVTDYDKIEGSREVAEIMQEMASVLLSFMETMPMAAKQGTEEIVLLKMFEQLGGFPVATTSYKNGVKRDSSKLLSVKEVELGTFGPPKGYREQKLDRGCRPGAITWFAFA